MADFALEHFTASGGPKHAFETQDEAWKFRNAQNGMKSKKAHQCTTCGKWHLDSRRRADSFQKWYDARNE